MAARSDIPRRDFLLRPLGQGEAAPAASADPQTIHISSAVLTVRPERAAEIAQALGALPGVEVHAVQHAKIVVVMEATDSGALGARLAQMALMDGVFSANMVFEQADGPEPGGVP